MPVLTDRGPGEHWETLRTDHDHLYQILYVRVLHFRLRTPSASPVRLRVVQIGILYRYYYCIGICECEISGRKRVITGTP